MNRFVLLPAGVGSSSKFRLLCRNYYYYATTISERRSTATTAAASRIRRIRSISSTNSTPHLISSWRSRSWGLPMPSAAAAATAAVVFGTSHFSSSSGNGRSMIKRTLLEGARQSSNTATAATTTTTTTKKNGDENDSSSWFFSEDLSSLRDRSTGFWNRIVTKEIPPPSTSKGRTEAAAADDNKGDSDGSTTAAGSFDGIAMDFMKLLTGKQEQETVADIVAKVRQQTGHQEDVEEGGAVDDIVSGFTQVMDIIDTYSDDLAQTAEKYVGEIDFANIRLTSLLYYLEHEDERKNPSWKRRMHRFCPSLDFEKLHELYGYLEVALLCYADTVDEIRHGLESDVDDPYELVFADLSSAPGKPASFVAVKRNQSYWSSQLEVIIGVRGTKTFADAITDLLCDATEYRGGKAHSFIVSSGQYVATKHANLLEELRREAGKKTIKLTLVGHSLGAGAASIAGIELNDKYDHDVQVVGFGCPALLSKDLAEQSTFITTIVNDNDIVPRMSGIHFANLLMDVMEFNWLPYAKKDIEHALAELHRFQPTFFTQDVLNKFMKAVEEPLENFGTSTVKAEKSERIEPELFPPGRCVHFYRDGYGISAAFVPNDFFQEIDLNRRMIDDHVIFSGYQKSMLDAVRAYKRDHNYRLDEKKGKE